MRVVVKRKGIFIVIMAVLLMLQLGMLLFYGNTLAYSIANFLLTNITDNFLVQYIIDYT